MGDCCNSVLNFFKVVDVRDPQEGCRDTFVYIADVTGYGIIVYDMLNNKSWRVENKLTYPFPPFGTFHIQGIYCIFLFYFIITTCFVY